MRKVHKNISLIPDLSSPNNLLLSNHKNEEKKKHKSNFTEQRE